MTCVARSGCYGDARPGRRNLAGSPPVACASNRAYVQYPVLQSQPYIAAHEPRPEKNGVVGNETFFPRENCRTWSRCRNCFRKHGRARFSYGKVFHAAWWKASLRPTCSTTANHGTRPGCSGHPGRQHRPRAQPHWRCARLVPRRRHGRRRQHQSDGQTAAQSIAAMEKLAGANAGLSARAFIVRTIRFSSAENTSPCFRAR